MNTEQIDTQVVDTEVAVEPQAAVAVAEVKTRKTRTVDYARTDKKPHSFRYKRGSAFTARSGAVSLSKESDGALVIGPRPVGVDAEDNAEKFEGGTLKLVAVKKRANGKIAITFEKEGGGQVIAYDARAARAALRAT